MIYWKTEENLLQKPCSCCYIKILKHFPSSWCRNFVKTHSFHKVSGKSTEPLQKLCVPQNFYNKKLVEITVFYAALVTYFSRCYWSSPSIFTKNSYKVSGKHSVFIKMCFLIIFSLRPATTFSLLLDYLLDYSWTILKCANCFLETVFGNKLFKQNFSYFINTVFVVLQRIKRWKIYFVSNSSIKFLC